jgi:hypothetical protein
MADPREKVGDDEIIRLLKTGERPVWAATDIAEEFDITRQTAHNRLKRIEQESDEVESVKVGRVTGYYVPDTNPLPPAETLEGRHSESIVKWATDRFMGLESAPWTAVHPNDGPAEGGDKIQIWVEGQPGRWAKMFTFSEENRREKLYDDEIRADVTQALVTGTLYERPTVPIEHIGYPDDYNLEEKIGVRDVKTDKGTAFIAAGPKKHLIRPCNDAVFLTDVSVEWISPHGEGKETDMMTFDASGEEVDAEIIEEATERAEEFLDDYNGGDEPGL